MIADWSAEWAVKEAILNGFFFFFFVCVKNLNLNSTRLLFICSAVLLRVFYLKKKKLFHLILEKKKTTGGDGSVRRHRTDLLPAGRASEVRSRAELQKKKSIFFSFGLLWPIEWAQSEKKRMIINILGFFLFGYSFWRLIRLLCFIRLLSDYSHTTGASVGFECVVHQLLGAASVSKNFFLK